MHATVTNLTGNFIICDNGSRKARKEHIVLPPSSSKVLAKVHSKLVLRLGHERSEEDFDASMEEKALIKPRNFSISMNSYFGSSWRAHNLSENCPWRVYQSRISRRHHRLLILPRRDLSSFLSEMPDSAPLSALLLPGTHDTMAFYGWPVSQCQFLSTPLAVQFQSGIRVIDIRLAVINGRLLAYHGLSPQRTPFQHILTTVHDFLSAPATCRETIVMSIKQEDFYYTSPAVFSKCVHDEIMDGPGGNEMWFLDNRVPMLGEVRGKVVMFSRFGGDGTGWEGGTEGMGMHPTNWPDSEKIGFTWPCKNTLVRTHDWYAIPSFLSIPEKVELSTRILLPPLANPPVPILSITYFSAASFPLAFPPTIARGFGYPNLGLGVEGVNSRVGKWLLDILSDGSEELSGHPGGDMEKGGSDMGGVRIRGWTFMDFYTDPIEHGVVPLLVECNFRGRHIGEEGWV